MRMRVCQGRRMLSAAIALAAAGIGATACGTTGSSTPSTPLSGLSADQIARFRDPATQILQAIDELKPAMVTMGTHGRKGIERFLLGSVTERVVRSSTAPVLTVHARPQ